MVDFINPYSSVKVDVCCAQTKCSCYKIDTQIHKILNMFCYIHILYAHRLLYTPYISLHVRLHSTFIKEWWNQVERLTDLHPSKKKTRREEADCLPTFHLEEGRARTRVCWLRASSTSQQPARAPAFIQFNKAALSQLWCSMIHITTYVYSK